MPVVVDDQFQLRRDTMAAFVAAGLVPLNGEPIVITDPATGRFSTILMGNGVDTVDKLPALSKGDTGPKGEPGADGEPGLPGTNGVATDQAVASNLLTDGTQTRTAALSMVSAALTATRVNATSLDSVIAALDMRDTRSIVIGAVGDSTADYSDEWFETCWRELFAERWPDRPARLKRWNRTDDQYPAAFTTWQTASTPGAPSDPGGTYPDTIVGSDQFSRVGELVGSNMDVGAAGWTGTSGVLSTDGDRLVTTGASTAIVAATLKTRSGADFTAKALMRITSQASANRQSKFYGVRNGSANDLEIAFAGSTMVTVTVVKRISGTATTLGTFPAGTIPSNTAAADYQVQLKLSGTTLTATVNGATLTFTLTESDVTAVESMTQVGFTSATDTTWMVDNLEVRGTVVVPPSGGSDPQPSPLGYASVYNGAIAGSTIDSQRTRLPRIMPERPDVLFITHGHNYGPTVDGPQFAAYLEAFLKDLFALYDDKIPVVVMSENPRYIADAAQAPHAARQVYLRAYALQKGWGYIPGFEAFAALTNGADYVQVDGVHPKPVGATPSGSRLQADRAKATLLRLSKRP